MKNYLLAIVAVLMFLNLLLMGSRTVEAENTVAGPPIPTIVKLLPITLEKYWRVWSDGRVDHVQRDNICDWSVTGTLGPVVHPFPVVDVVFDGAFLMTYGDGRVDIAFPAELPENRCTIEGIGTPSFCTGDTDRDGSVNVTDLLDLLSQWGSVCQ